MSWVSFHPHVEERAPDLFLLILQMFVDGLPVPGLIAAAIVNEKCICTTT
jgi:hypothetical protein